MSRLSIKYIIVLLVTIFAACTVVEAQSTRGKNPEKALFGKHRKFKPDKKKKKSKEPRSVRKAKEKQAKNQAKLKDEYFDYVDASKKRAYEIQSPEVKARMKQDQKNIKEREKAKHKKRDSATKRGAKKYKK